MQNREATGARVVGFIVLYLTLILFTALLWLPPASTLARPRHTEHGTPFTSLVYIMLDGSFRWQGEVWRGVDMGLAPRYMTFGTYPPLEQKGRQGSNVVESSDMRLRLEPAIYAGERGVLLGRIDLTVYAGYPGFNSTSNLGEATMASYPAEPGISSFSSQAAVRYLYAKFDLFHLATVKLGRIPSHLGLGIVENIGNCIDCNGTTAIDSIQIELSPYRDYRFSASMDMPVGGMSVEQPVGIFHQGYDVSDFDDVLQYRFRIENLPPWKNGPLIRWSLYSRIAWQDFSSSSQNVATATCKPLGGWQIPYQCGQLYWRDAFFWVPDVWVSFKTPLGKVLFLLEIELAGTYASLGATQKFAGKDTRKKIIAGGAVARSSMIFNNLELTLEGGVASGDKQALAFGTNDRPIVAEPDDSKWESSPVSTNKTITTFIFNQDYYVDYILFRRILGGISSAWYFKPNFKVQITTKGKLSAWVAGSLIYARATTDNVTPGKGSDLGLETNLTAGINLGKQFSGLAGAGLLYPLSGLRAPDISDVSLPWTVRLSMFIAF